MPALRDRLPALAALAIPVMVGAIWMATSGAPSHYPLVNLGVLLLASAWMAFGRGPHTALSRHLLFAAMIVLMLAAIAVGPAVEGISGQRIARWFPVGPLNLHTGMIAVPPLVVLAARNRVLAAPILLAGLGVAFLQPDAASGFALTFAAIGIHHVTRDWKTAVTAIIGFGASIAMALRGELPPQPFVERVFVDAASQSPFLAILLLAALVASFLLLLFSIPFARDKRFGLAGALFGFTAIAAMNHYPTPFIGYGAAPIIGFGLALGLHRIPQR